jgi:hypothetical protein
VQLPAGFTLVSPPAFAKDVLYQNSSPFALVQGGAASLLAGDMPKLPLDRIVADAQLLALDRSVPLADMGLLRLQYVVATFGSRAKTMRVTIGISELTQVDAVELRFPTNTQVAKVSGPPGTDGLPIANGIQLIASHGSFQAGLPYAFTLRLSRVPARGESVIVRASTHYFESALPFTERFVLQ